MHSYTNIYIPSLPKSHRKEENMVRYCIYCKTGVDEHSVIDFCERCGIGVWGEKMFKTIVQNMEKARDAGDLNQGSVGNSTAPAQRYW